MSKYIVDIDDFEPHFKVDSIGVFGIGKSLSYSEEDHSWSRIKSIEEFEELNSDYINEHYGELQDEAYQKGFEDGKKSVSEPDRIEVGDEVEWDGDKYVVTYLNYNIEKSEITDYDLLAYDGSVVDHVKKYAFTKTGKHYDIQSILEAMRK